MGQTRLSSTGSSAWPRLTCDFAKHLSYSVGVNPQGGTGPKLRCLVGQTLVFLGAGHEWFRDGRNRGMLKRYSGPLQRNLQHFIHGFYKMDREAGEYLLGDVRQVLLIVLRKQYRTQAHSVGGQQFFLNAADRQNLAAKSDFPGHSHIAADGNSRKSAYDGSANGNACRRAIFGYGALRHVQVNIETSVEIL